MNGGDPDWEDQLRRMLDAILSGGFTELVEPERHGYLRTFAFASPRGEPLIRRASYAGVERPERCETRFPGYR